MKTKDFNQSYLTINLRTRNRLELNKLKIRPNRFVAINDSVIVFINKIEIEKIIEKNKKINTLFV